MPCAHLDKLHLGTTRDDCNIVFLGKESNSAELEWDRCGFIRFGHSSSHHEQSGEAHQQQQWQPTICRYGMDRINNGHLNIHHYTDTLTGLSGFVFEMAWGFLYTINVQFVNQVCSSHILVFFLSFSENIRLSFCFFQDFHFDKYSQFPSPPSDSIHPIQHFQLFLRDLCSSSLMLVKCLRWQA